MSVCEERTAVSNSSSISGKIVKALGLEPLAALAARADEAVE
jgi:hypothetical protein